MCCCDFLLLLALSITSTHGMTPKEDWTTAATECESQGRRLPTFSEAISMNLDDVWVLDRLYYTTWFYLRSCVNASSLINETGALFVDDPLQCFAFCKSRGHKAMNLQRSDANLALCRCSSRTNNVGFSRSCGRCSDDSYFVCGRDNSFVAQYTWGEEMITESSTSKLNWESDMCLTVGCVQTDTGFEFSEKDCAAANVPFCALEDIKEMTVDTKFQPFREAFDICLVGYPVFSTNITCSASSSSALHWVNAFRLLKTCYSSNDSDCQQFMIENPLTFKCQKINNEELEATKKCDDDVKFFCVDKNYSSTTMTPTTQNIISVSVESSSDTTTMMSVESSTMPQNETIKERNATLGQDKQESPIIKAFPTGIVLGVMLPLVAASIGVLLYCLIRRKKTMSTKKALSEGDRGNTTGPYTLPYDCVKNDEVNRSSFYAQTTEANPSESEPSNQHTNEYVLPKDDLQHIAEGNQYEHIQDSVLDKSNATVIQQQDTANYSECNLDCYDKLHQNESLKNSSHDQYDKVKVIVQDDKEADDYDHLRLDSNEHSNDNCLYYSNRNNLGTNKESVYNSLNEEECCEEVCYS